MSKMYVGVWDDKNEKELWAATNITVQANYLVMLDIGFTMEDLHVSQRYKAFLEDFSRDALVRQDVSQHVWLFATRRSLQEMFHGLLSCFGVQYHSFTVVELGTGQGFGYCPKRRVVFEIEPISSPSANA